MGWKLFYKPFFIKFGLVAFFGILFLSPEKSFAEGANFYVCSPLNPAMCKCGDGRPIFKNYKKTLFGKEIGGSYSKFVGCTTPSVQPRCDTTKRKFGSRITWQVYNPQLRRCVNMHSSTCPEGQEFVSVGNGKPMVCRNVQAQAAHSNGGSHTNGKAPREKSPTNHGNPRARGSVVAAPEPTREEVRPSANSTTTEVTEQCSMQNIQRSVQQCAQDQAGASEALVTVQKQQERFSDAFRSMFPQGMPVGGNIVQNCAQMVDALAPTRNTVEQLNTETNNQVGVCLNSCGQAKQLITQTCAQYYPNNALATSQGAVMASVGQCEQVSTEVNKTKNQLEQIGTSLVSAAGCASQVAALSAKGNDKLSPSEIPECVKNPDSVACRKNVCTNPDFAKTSSVCQCASNPTSSACRLANNSESTTFPSGKSTFGGTGSNVDFDLGGGGNVNPAEFVSTDGQKKPGLDPGGQKGGSPGTLGGGAAGGGSVGSAGGGGDAANDPTDILNGWRGGNASGGAGFAGGGAAITGEGGSSDPSADSAEQNLPNLDEFRPDMAYDPKFNRGIAGVAGPDGIRGAYTNIFDNMKEAFSRQRYNFIFGQDLKNQKK